MNEKVYPVTGGKDYCILWFLLFQNYNNYKFPGMEDWAYAGSWDISVQQQ